MTIMRERFVPRIAGGWVVALAVFAGVLPARAGDAGAGAATTGRPTSAIDEKFSLQEGMFGLEARDDDARRAMLDRQSGFLAGSYSGLPLASPSVDHKRGPASGNGLTSNGDVGGYVGYWFREAPGSPSSIGVNLGILGSRTNTTGAWSLQPGVDFARSFYDGWYLKTRLFTTYGAPSARDGLAAGPYGPALVTGDGTGDGGFSDLGLGMGLGYSLGQNWGVQTQARYLRQLRGSDGSLPDKSNKPNQFFGGVMLDYKF